MEFPDEVNSHLGLLKIVKSLRKNAGFLGDIYLFEDSQKNSD